MKKLHEPVSGLTHLFAALVAVLLLTVLIYLSRRNLVNQLSVTIYGLSLVAMFSASSAYHLIKAGPRLSLWLRKLDHTSIYLLIAGTYTPICLYFFDGFYRWGILGIIWLLALIGISVKLLTMRAPRWTSPLIYLGMGWLSILAVRQILLAMPPGAIFWLLLGGIFFSIGAVIYTLQRPNFAPGVFGYHELWHIFVILGAFCHFILIAAFIAPAGTLG
jgi:hemolysin III